MKAWPLVPLGEVLTKSDEWIRLNPLDSYRQVTVKMWGQGLVERSTVTGQQIGSDKRLVVHANQFLVSRIDARNGASGLVPPSLDGAVVSNDFPAFTADPDRLDPPFLGYYSKTAKFVEDCTRSSEGSTNRVRLKEERFLAMSMPLPPLEEQWRIVERIEGVRVKHEQAVALHSQAAEMMDIVLCAEAKRIREDLCAKFQSRCLSEITTVSSGGTPARSNPAFWESGTVRWVKTGELCDSEIWDTEEKITTAALGNSGAKLFLPETVLIAMYGQGQTRGRTAILKVEASTNQACAAILPRPDLLKSKFLQYWLRSLYHEMRLETRGGAQPNWNGAMIGRIPMVTPSLETQCEVIRRLETLENRIEVAQRKHRAASAELDALMPSILNHAFSGQL